MRWWSMIEVKEKRGEIAYDTGRRHATTGGLLTGDSPGCSHASLLFAIDSYVQKWTAVKLCQWMDGSGHLSFS